MLMMQQLMKRTDLLFGMNLRRGRVTQEICPFSSKKKSCAFLRILANIVGFLAYIVGFLAHSCGTIFWYTTSKMKKQCHNVNKQENQHFSQNAKNHCAPFSPLLNRRTPCCFFGLQVISVTQNHSGVLELEFQIKRCFKD